MNTKPSLPQRSTKREEGIISEESELEELDFFGGVGQYAVIFTTDGVESGDLADLGWLQQFPRGYGVGKGIEIPDNNFDDFEPVEPSTVEIIVGDLGDIEFVNWH